MPQAVPCRPRPVLRSSPLPPRWWIPSVRAPGQDLLALTSDLLAMPGTPRFARSASLTGTVRPLSPDAAKRALR